MVRLNLRELDGALAGRLSSRFSGDLIAHDICFRALSETEVAFREVWSGRYSFLRYAPAMHGLIRCVPERGTTYVIGWVNWYVVVLAALMVRTLVRSESYPRPMGFVFFGLVAVLCTGIQVYRYRKVAASVVNRKRLRSIR